MPKKNISFDNAILKSEQGEFLADGKASINVKGKTVTFESNFVPLYPIGTQMEVVRVLDKKEVHRFWGKVYLSDKKLMRIVSAQDELLPGSEEVYCNDMNFMAIANSNFCVELNKKGIFRQRTIEKEIKKEFDITILSMTKKGLRLRLENLRSKGNEAEDIDYLEKKRRLYELQIEVGQPFSISSNATLLPFKKMEVEVSKILPSSISPCFECKFVYLTDEESKNIYDFLWRYNIIFNKLFN